MVDLFIKQIPIGPMMNYAYLVGAENGAGVVAIDTAWSADHILRAAKENNKNIEAILLTHTHFDHCNAAEELARKIHIPIYVHELETEELPGELDVKVTRPDMTIEIAGVSIRCMHTPGHTPGSQCFLVNDVIFTGDTLFVDGCGRVDLPGSDPKQMVASLSRLATLPDQTKIFPGHDYGTSPTTTIGEQKRTNPYLMPGETPPL
jgi:glyoxylase-like metal-dependent hydrolase (beta-lactamase superfamily II)